MTFIEPVCSDKPNITYLLLKFVKLFGSFRLLTFHYKHASRACQLLWNCLPWDHLNWLYITNTTQMKIFLHWKTFKLPFSVQLAQMWVSTGTVVTLEPLTRLGILWAISRFTINWFANIVYYLTKLSDSSAVCVAFRLHMVSLGYIFTLGPHWAEWYCCGPYHLFMSLFIHLYVHCAPSMTLMLYRPKQFT